MSQECKDVLIRTDRLVLREFRRDDFPAVREYDARPETHAFQGEAIPDETATAGFIDRCIANGIKSPRREHAMVITMGADPAARGHIILSSGNPAIGEHELGWTVHPECCSRGYATEAASAVLALAFGELGAHRVVAYYNSANRASRRVAEKVGMIQEGTFRESRRWRGGWSDECSYAMLDKEWTARP